MMQLVLETLAAMPLSAKELERMLRGTLAARQIAADATVDCGLSVLMRLNKQSLCQDFQTPNKGVPSSTFPFYSIAC